LITFASLIEFDLYKKTILNRKEQLIRINDRNKFILIRHI